MWALRKWRWDNYALVEWSESDLLHLQSAVHEELGFGTWTRRIGDVPTTRGTSERLAVLDPSDSEHPRFRAPPPTFERQMKDTTPTVNETQRTRTD